MKNEGEPNLVNSFTKIASSSSRRWSVHKNPRIVPVSRSFGGKDRHSKVSTVRGLRDRRIRLSVPTAIQLYDLQEKLGFSQPSKVVDWLLDATKNDIDKLPALPMVPIFTHLTHQPLIPSHPIPANPQTHFLSSYPKDLGINPAKGEGKMNEDGEGRDKWSASHSQEGLGGFVAQLSAQNLFPLGNQSVFTNIPYSPYFHLDHQSMPLSQFGGGYANFTSPQSDDHNQSDTNVLPSILPSSSQLHLPPSNIPSFPCSINNDLRQISHLQHVQPNPLLPTTLNLISSTMNVNSQKDQPREKDTAGRSRN